MSNATRWVTIMLVPEGTEGSMAWRVRQWVIYAVLGGLATLVMAIILFFIFYGQIIQRAAQADKLSEENEGLLRYRYKVQLLEDNLDQARDFVGRVATLAGIDFEFPELPDDSVLFAELDNPRPATLSRSWADDLSFPSGLPLAGFITQDFEITDANRFHPGLDIACAIGTPVLATGEGIVEYADYDSTYGKTLIIEHNDSITTLYGHNDTILVHVGQRVLAGTRIALSGNTGRSSAPHMHYEVRINEQPINPLRDEDDEKNKR